MANLEGVYSGLTISKVNGIKSDGVLIEASPNLFVALDSSDTSKFILPTKDGGTVLGVLLPDYRFEEAKTQPGKSGNIQIAGVVDVICDGDVVANHLVIATAEGKAKDIGSIESGLSSTITGLNCVAGIAVENGVDGGKVAVLLCKQIVELS
mgnify:CR=1 FL=1